MQSEPAFDEKARRSYQRKIRELEEEIRWSENNNDLQRTATLHQEYDNIVDHLTSSLGLRGKVRKTHDVLDKTRSAVTWRIRNTIQKIEKVHPLLAKHLSVSIRTGLFCAYNPEKPVRWITGKKLFGVSGDFSYCKLKTYAYTGINTKVYANTTGNFIRPDLINYSCDLWLTHALGSLISGETITGNKILED